MLENELIAYGSATLARLKAGSLFSVPFADAGSSAVHALNQCLEPRGVTLTRLRLRQGRVLMYLYRPDALAAILGRSDVHGFLRSFGYADFRPDAALSTLRRRLARQGGFPHEIGVFLGYPLSDVTGFILHQGRDALCSGCWKCYADPDSALRAFAKLRRCQRVYEDAFRRGLSLERLTVPSATVH